MQINEDFLSKVVVPFGKGYYLGSRGRRVVSRFGRSVGRHPVPPGDRVRCGTEPYRFAVVAPTGSQAEIIPWGSMTNFWATPLSKALYPAGASSSEIGFALTAFAMWTLSERIAFIKSRL